MKGKATLLYIILYTSEYNIIRLTNYNYYERLQANTELTTNLSKVLQLVCTF